MFDCVTIDPESVRYGRTCVLFFAIASLHGEAKLNLTLEDLADNEILRSVVWKVEGDDPVHSTDVMIRMSWLPVPHPGAYAWNVYDEDGELLGSCRYEARIAN